MMNANVCTPLRVIRIIEPQKRFLQAIQARGVSKSVWLDHRKLLLDMEMAYDSQAPQLNIFDEKRLSKEHDKLADPKYEGLNWDTYQVMKHKPWLEEVVPNEFNNLPDHMEHVTPAAIKPAVIWVRWNPDNIQHSQQQQQ